MATELRSLRITADLDAGRYVAGMNEKIAADRAGTQSSDRLGDSVDNAKIKISSSLSVLERMSRQYVDGYGTASRFNAEILLLARSQDTHATSVEHLEQVYAGMQRRYGLIANANELAERGYLDLATAIGTVNRRLEEQAVVAARSAAAMQTRGMANDNSPNGFNAANIAFQMQDIAVTAAMGMNPLMIGLQQGSQLAGAYQGMNIRTAAATTAAAVTGLLSPVSLLSVGFSAALAAGIQFFTTSSSESEKATKALEDHEATIASVAKKYGDATPILRDYVAAREKAKDFEEIRTSFNALAEQEFAGPRKAIEALRDEFAALTIDLNQAGADPETLIDVQNAFNGVRAAIEQGSSASADFERTQNSLSQAFTQTGVPAIDEILKKVRQLADEYSRAGGEAKKLRDEPFNLRSGGTAVSDILEGTFFSDNGVVRRRSDFLPRDGSVRAPEKRPNIELDWGEADRVRLEIENSRRRLQAEIQAMQARSVNERAAAARAMEEANVIHGEDASARQNRIAVAELRARAEAENSLSEAQRQRSFSLQETMRSQEMEISLIGKTAGQIAAMQLQYQLMAELRQEAYQNGITNEAEFARVYGAQTALIAQRSAEYGKQVEIMAQLGLQQKLQFDREQLGRSAIDQQIASSQRGSGLPVDLSNDYANEVRSLERLKELRGDVTGFFQDFRDGLMKGESWGSALGNALMNSLTKAFNRQTDRLIDNLVNSLFNALGSGGSGGVSGGLNKAIGFTGANSVLSDLLGIGAANDNVASATSAASVLRSAGVTKTGIPLSVVTAGNGMTANVASQYAGRFQGLFNDLKAAGYNISSLGEGGYSYRNVAGTNNLSKHSFGEAVDINPRQNPWSHKFQTDLPANINDIAKRNGLTWGGTWNKPDTMHFQVDKSAEMASSALDKMAGNVGAATVGLGQLGTGLNQTVNGLGQVSQQLMSAVSGANGPANGGGILGGLGSLLGGISPTSSLWRPNTTLGAWLGVGMSDGGYTGSGGVYEPRGVVHAGEVVWSQRDVARAGGVAVVEAMRLGMQGYAMGGAVEAAASSRSAGGAVFNIYTDNPRGDRDIEDAVDRGVRRGIKAYDAKMPDRVKQINKRPYVRGQ